MLNIYTLPISIVLILIVSTPIVFGSACSMIQSARAKRCVAGLLFIMAIFAVYYYCIFDRTPGVIHRFVVMSPYYPEFHRELIMNAFLYVPFGMSVPYLLQSPGKYRVVHTVGIAFLLSLCIEYWQFIQGTGVAQVSDLVMNTLGAFIGAQSFTFSRWFETKRFIKSRKE